MRRLLHVSHLRDPEHTLEQVAKIDGVWADDADVDNLGGAPQVCTTWKEETGWPGEYFGSVAFKVGPEVLHPERAAEVAQSVMDVVTTSGTATGVPPDVDKVRARRGALEGHRLAVASGITPDNVEDYLPFVDDYLVATGISRDFHTLDPAKVRALAETVHAGE